MTATVKGSPSWVIRERATGRVLFETFNLCRVAMLKQGIYEAVPIREYMHSVALNARIHENNWGTQ